MSILARCFFACHFVGKTTTLVAWTVTPYALPLQWTVMCSWWCNRNRCLLSQLELRWFGRTFWGHTQHARVGWLHRVHLYAHFCAGVLWWFVIRQSNYGLRQ